MKKSYPNHREIQEYESHLGEPAIGRSTKCPNSDRVDRDGKRIRLRVCLRDVWVDLVATNCQATAQTAKSMEATAETLGRAPKPLNMLLESGASGHHFDDELQSDPKDKLLN